MKNSIFTKESLDRISSPEKLNDYVKVATPGVWMILGSIIVLLIGFVAWGFFGSMDSKIDTCAIAKDDKVVCFVDEKDLSKIKVGQEVEVDGNQYKVISISSEPIQVKGNFSDYEKHIGGLSDEDWVYGVTTDAKLSNGVSKASITTESIPAISFILN